MKSEKRIKLDGALLDRAVVLSKIHAAKMNELRLLSDKAELIRFQLKAQTADLFADCKKTHRELLGFMPHELFLDENNMEIVYFGEETTTNKEAGQ